MKTNRSLGAANENIENNDDTNSSTKFFLQWRNPGFALVFNN